MEALTEIRQSERIRHAVIILGLTLLVIVVRLPGLNQPLEDDSSAIAYHARLIARGEPLYSSHHTGHHLPAAYYVYAISFALLGDQVASVKVVLVVWIAITVYLIYKLGTLVANERTGVLSAIFAAMLSGHIVLEGNHPKIETFVMLPQTAAIFTALYLSGRKARSSSFILVGIFIAASFLFKANYLFAPAFVTGLVLLSDLWREREQSAAWRQFVTRGLAIISGFTSVVILVCIYFWLHGVLANALAVFRIGFEYTGVADTNPSQLALVLFYPIRMLAGSNVALTIAGLTAPVIIAMQARHRLKKGIVQNSILLISAWFLACFVEAGIPRLNYPYYYLIFVPSLSILAGWLADQILEKIERPALLRGSYVLILVLVVLANGRSQHRYMFEYARYVAGLQTYDQFLVAGLPEGVGGTALAVEDIAVYLTGRTAPEDTIYYWSNVMQLYYALDRRSSATIIWPIYAAALHPREQIFTAKYFLVDYYGFVPLGYSEHPDWLWAGLEQHYELETTLYGQQIYRHK